MHLIGLEVALLLARLCVARRAVVLNQQVLLAKPHIDHCEGKIEIRLFKTPWSHR